MAKNTFRLGAEWVGLDEMEAQFAALERRFSQQALQAITNKGAEPMVMEAKRMVRRKTLQGQRSIQAFEGAGDLERTGLRLDEATTRVGWSQEAFYLYFLEFGTRHQPPYPFFRPAFDGTAQEAIRIMHRAARIIFIRGV